MCQLLGVSRANIYKFKEKKLQEDPYTQRVINIFRDNRQAYGTRRIKAACARIGIVISKRRIARIMKEKRSDIRLYSSTIQTNQKCTK